MSDKGYPSTYAVKHKDENVRSNSRSGGVFTALSDFVLEQGGIVYGCVMKNTTEAVHIRATTKAERDLMRGSKYIQSEMGQAFRLVKEDLDAGKMVLFSGTSCQVAGLSCYLGKEYANLFLVDILCHGVPSQHVWKLFVEWEESKYGKSKTVDFRNKIDYGWKEHVETIKFIDNRSISSKIYTSIFYGHYSLRPCCYECKYKTVSHPGNLTIADYWEIDRALPGFNDNKGVSLVFVNDECGKDLLKTIEDDLVCVQTNYEDSTRPSMFKSAHCPENRKQFWHDINTRSFEYVAKKYGGYGTFNNIKRMIKKLIHR